MPNSNLCPCGSKICYDECCGRYHKGALCENALKLMRSRYSAYAKYLPDYIIKTTHPDNPSFTVDFEKWRKEISQFSRNTDFVGLDILEFVDGKEKAQVTFTAYLKQRGEDAGFTEKSNFVLIEGRWLYKNGQIIEHKTKRI